MNPSEIQLRTLLALNQVGVHILRSTLYSLSSEYDEEGSEAYEMMKAWWLGEIRRQRKPADLPTPSPNCFMIGFICTREEFWQAARLAGEMGVWFNYSWLPYGNTDKYEYFVVAVERLP